MAGLVASGCGESAPSEPTTSGTSADAPSATSAADGGSGDEGFQNASCESSARAGGFTVQLEDGYTQVEGQVFDAPSPVQKVELDAADGCRLLITENYFCDPPCGASGICTAAETCAPKPVAVDVGEVSVAGLSAAVSMEPNVTNFYLNLGELPFPGFEPGAEIELRAAGGEGEGFVLAGMGSEPFDLDVEEVPVAEGTPVSLRWTPPSGVVPTRVHIDLDIGHHGGSPATIECDVEDTGSFEIPATLVDQLFEFGVAGFPYIELTRSTEDSVMLGERCVELRVAPRTSALAVLIDGVESCSTDADCSDGKICQNDLSCG